MSSTWKATVALVVGLLAGGGGIWLATSRDTPVNNWPDCVLASIGDGVSDQAVAMVAAMCREKFPAPNSTEWLSESMGSKVTGRGSVSTDRDFYEATVYNGNREWQITEVEFGFMVVQGSDTTNRTYSTKVTLQPLSAELVRFRIFPLPRAARIDSWWIARVRGKCVPSRPPNVFDCIL